MSEPARDDLAWFDDCLRAPTPPLSAVGDARRSAMRGLLTQRVVRRRRVRRAIQAGLAMALAGGLAWAWPAPAERPDLGPNPDVTMLHAEFSFVPSSLASPVPTVRDDASLHSRWRVGTEPTLEIATLENARVDDAQLLDLLHASPHPQGFVRVGARVLLAAELEE